MVSSLRGGEVAEWFKAHAWKACVANPYRGFKSLPLRQISFLEVFNDRWIVPTLFLTQIFQHGFQRGFRTPFGFSDWIYQLIPALSVFFILVPFPIELHSRPRVMDPIR